MDFETNNQKPQIKFSFNRNSGINFQEAEQGNNALDFDLPDYVPMPTPEEEKTVKFLSISFAMHLAAALAISLLSIQMALNPPPEEVVEIQVLSKGTHSMAASRPGPLGGAVMQTTKSELKSANLPTSKEDVLVKAQKAKAPPAKIAKVKEVAKPQPLLAKESPVITKVKAKKASIEDIENPNLDLDKEKLQARDLQEDDIFDDIEQERKKHEAENLAREMRELKEIENQAQSLAAESNARLGKIAKLGASQGKDLSARQNALFAGVQGTGRGVGSKDSSAQGSGSVGGGKALSGGVGGNKNTSESYGSPNGIRTLEQLKQMPGNQRPQYGSDDRYKNREGIVSFVAYVGNDGVIQKMLLKKTTGHRTLDAKALAAIKHWKFYPGQEGWVEIPFNWSLKGAPELKGPILRRSSAQR